MNEQEQEKWLKEQGDILKWSLEEAKAAFMNRWNPENTRGKGLRKNAYLRARNEDVPARASKGSSKAGKSFNPGSAIEALKADFSAKLDGLKAQMESQAQAMDPNKMSGMDLLKMAQGRLAQEAAPKTE
jgi:hypothetical protein